MIIIGFDPGLGHTGYAVLNKTGKNLEIELQIIGKKS